MNEIHVRFNTESQKWEIYNSRSRQIWNSYESYDQAEEVLNNMRKLNG